MLIRNPLHSAEGFVSSIISMKSVNLLVFKVGSATYLKHLSVNDYEKLGFVL
jgi:hypothetical protein